MSIDPDEFEEAYDHDLLEDVDLGEDEPAEE